MFIDDIRFSLVGTFNQNPMTFPSLVYLFVPPIPIEEINGLYSIRYPLPSALFYWSLDPNGRNDHIPHDQWKAYGIPVLEVSTWMGSSLYWTDYETVREHLQRKNVSLDGRQHARDCGYPELIHGEYHLCVHDRIIFIHTRPRRSSQSKDRGGRRAGH